MNRREMIIVAALINAGLLVILFISAVQKEPIKDFAALPPSKKKQAKFQEEKKITFLDRDPIDHKLGISRKESYEKGDKKKRKKQALSPLILTPKNLTPSLEKTSSKNKTQGENRFEFVTIKKGDVLEKIAKKHGVLVEEIKSLNGLSDSCLQIGQILKIPLKEKVLKERSQEKYYVVKGGDNPWTIAKENGIQVEELLRLNNMDEKKAKKLRPGDKLRIR